MATVQLGQYFTASVTWTKPDGEPIEPFGGDLPTWTCDKQNVIEYTPSPGTPGLLECRGIKIGDCTITATASFDTGYGVHPSSKSEPISVVTYVTPDGEIDIVHGTILPIR